MAWDKQDLRQSYSCNSELLVQLRKRRGWTQEDMAKVSGYSDRLIRKAESGRSISTDTIADLAEALSVPGDEVYPEDLICDPVELAKRFIEAWCVGQAGAVEMVHHFLDDSIVFELIGEPEQGIPFAGRYEGIEELDAFFKLFFSMIEVPPNYDHDKWYDYFGDGNNVSIVGQSWLHPIGNPLQKPIETAMLVTFKRGKIAYIRDLVDTEAGGRALASAKPLSSE